MVCVYYMDFDRVWPKDSYPQSNIDKLLDNSVGYKLLSFIDTYFGYNQIPMFGPGQIMMSLMTKKANYQYNVMPFRVKNVGATYQMMLNKIFQGEIWDTLEVYNDDMIVKSIQEELHAQHL